MAVPTGDVTMAAVRQEFGGPPGTPLHAYVRGGAYVPNVSQNANVPTAPPIQLGQLAGAVRYIPLTIVGPAAVDWNGFFNSGGGNVYTTSSGQSTSGGNASKTYHWVMLSGATQISCDNAASISGPFSAQAVKFDVDWTAVYRLTVSDGSVTVTKDVTFSFHGAGTSQV